jgi:hypothetical protein
VHKKKKERWPHKEFKQAADTFAKETTSSRSKGIRTELNTKIALATEGFTSTKFYELLRDRNRLSKETALTLCKYIITMKEKLILDFKKYTIEFLSQLSRAVGIEKLFQDMSRDDVLFYLNKCRKPEDKDPLHKWIGSYDTKLSVLSRFFKWLYYHNIDNPKETSYQHQKESLIVSCAYSTKKERS